MQKKGVRTSFHFMSVLVFGCRLRARASLLAGVFGDGLKALAALIEVNDALGKTLRLSVIPPSMATN